MRRLEAIVLAAGSGARFGGGKLLAPYAGGVLIGRALRAAMASPVGRVIVVTGHDSDSVSETVRAIGNRDYPSRDLNVVYAERHHQGMAESLKVGLASLSVDVEGAFIFLGDMPRVPLFVAAKLADNIGTRRAAAPDFGGKRGHPVLVSSRLFPRLMTLSGDEGARKVLDALANDLLLVAVDDGGVLFDVDQRSDLAA